MAFPSENIPLRGFRRRIAGTIGRKREKLTRTINPLDKAPIVEEIEYLTELLRVIPGGSTEAGRGPNEDFSQQAAHNNPR